jgi:hypothetical protein
LNPLDLFIFGVLDLLGIKRVAIANYGINKQDRVLVLSVKKSQELYSIKKRSEFPQCH